MESFISLAIDKQKIKRTVECELIMSPLTLKAVHRFLGKQLEKYRLRMGNCHHLRKTNPNQGKINMNNQKVLMI